MPGTVNYAGWSFSWSIPSLYGAGLVISKANFNGIRVLFRAGAPFVLVPYHGNSPTFKDGLAPHCGGLPFTALIPTAPNVTGGALPPGTIATNDNQYNMTINHGGAVMVEQVPATLTEPAKAVVWAKFQCGNYQYFHRWQFQADGAILAEVGLGGRLLTSTGVSHIHNFYFRLDFDIVTAGNNLVQSFEHVGNNPGDDHWNSITVESKKTVDLQTFTKWRIINKTPKANGQFPSYELLPGSDGSPNGTYSTGDLWVVRYKSSGEDGANVNCNDNVLGTTYVNGETVDGQDVVIWYSLRTHHEPRELGEEMTVLPYEFIGFQMQPRNFLDNTLKNLYSTTPPSP
jgi:hypothetical protein